MPAEPAPDRLDSPDRPRLDPEHEARALVAVSRALREIPFYVKRGHAPIAQGATLAEALRGLPVLFKKDVRAALPKQWVPAGRDVKAELASGEIELVETSGSTGERLRVLWNRGWWLHQEARAFRVNPKVAALMDGAYHEAILTTPACGASTCHTGDLTFDERLDGHYLFLNTRPDPTFWTDDDRTRMLDELAKHHTVGLESDPMYLAALAEHAAKTGRTLGVSGFAVLTYAFTTRAYLRAIRRAFSGDLLQLYGASEVGVLFMEGEDGRLHHAPFTTHVELLPAKVATPGAKDVALVVATTIDREAMPLVRFCLNDLVQVDHAGPRRFTTVAPLVSMEGRVDDALVRPDGALVTAGALDRALEPIDAIRLFQANQRTPRDVEIDIVVDGAGDGIVDAVRARLAPLCEGMTVTPRLATAIAVEPSGKFRVARRHPHADLTLDLARAFEGL